MVRLDKPGLTFNGDTSESSLYIFFYIYMEKKMELETFQDGYLASPLVPQGLAGIDAARFMEDLNAVIEAAQVEEAGEA